MIDTSKDNNVLFAELDDVIQRLAHKNNVEWAKDMSDDMKNYRAIVKELYRRLNGEAVLIGEDMGHYSFITEEHLEEVTDQQKGTYDIEVMNHDGYYNSEGMFIRYQDND